MGAVVVLEDTKGKGEAPDKGLKDKACRQEEVGIFPAVDWGQRELGAMRQALARVNGTWCRGQVSGLILKFKLIARPSEWLKLYCLGSC